VHESIGETLAIWRFEGIRAAGTSGGRCKQIDPSLVIAQRGMGAMEESLAGGPVTKLSEAKT